MSADIRTDFDYQVAQFGDFGFRVLTGASVEGEKFSSVMALEDSTITITSTRKGDASASIDLVAGMVVYGDLAITALTGKVIAYLRDV